MSTLVGYLIVREPYEPNHSDAGGSDSEDYEGEKQDEFFDNSIPIYNDCTWVRFGGLKYKTRFGKKKKFLVLEVSDESSDEKKQIEYSKLHAQVTMEERLRDIKTLEKELCEKTLRLTNVNLTKRQKKQIMDEIDQWSELIQNHRKVLGEFVSSNFKKETKFTRTKKTTTLVLRQSQRCEFLGNVITWFHFSGDIQSGMEKETIDKTTWQREISVLPDEHVQTRILEAVSGHSPD